MKKVRGYLGKKHDILNLYFLLSRSFLFFYPLSLIEGSGLNMFKQIYFSNSLIIASKTIKCFQFNGFFNFCRNQMFLISYKNIQHFLQFIIDQKYNDQLIACCCYGHFLNADLGEVLYLFKRYNKNFLFIQIYIFIRIILLKIVLRVKNMLMCIQKIKNKK